MQNIGAPFWYILSKCKSHGALFKTTYCTHELTHISRCFGTPFWEFASGLKILIYTHAISRPFSKTFGLLCWFFHGERSSYGNRTRVHTNNGFFKLVEALLQIHSCLFSHSIKLRGVAVLFQRIDHYTFRTIPQEHWSTGMSMARPS